MEILPKSRTLNIVQQTMDNELLIYDTKTNKAFCLNQTSADIYNLCDGANDIAGIAEKTRLPKEIVQLAIGDLGKQDLLTQKIEIQASRRELLKKTALIAIALPVISALVAPTAAYAASDACVGTAPGGFLIGEYPSNINSGTNVCLRPARQTCLSCDYNRTTSNCNNSECTTVTCFCAPVSAIN